MMDVIIQYRMSNFGVKPKGEVAARNTLACPWRIARNEIFRRRKPRVLERVREADLLGVDCPERVKAEEIITGQSGRT